MKGNAQQTRVHYRGKEDDFVIFVENAQAVKDWKKDKSKPLSDVVNGWKVFVTHKQGAQGILDGASKAALDNEFGTHKDDDVVRQILERGDLRETEAAERQADRNIMDGPSVPH